MTVLYPLYSSCFVLLGPGIEQIPLRKLGLEVFVAWMALESEKLLVKVQVYLLVGLFVVVLQFFEHFAYRLFALDTCVGLWVNGVLDHVLRERRAAFIRSNSRNE